MSKHRRRAGGGDDSGSVIVFVLVIAILLIAAVGVAIASAQTSLGYSSSFKTSSQAEMAAQTGLATELTAMRSVASDCSSSTCWTSFPCSLTGSLDVPGAVSSYSTTVAYFANGEALTCSGSTLGSGTQPTTATLTAVGKATHAQRSVMREDVSISVSSTTSGASSPAALGYAIFSSNNVDLENAATLETGTSAPNVYVGQTLTCDNGTTSEGSLTTPDPVDLENNCKFDGSLTAGGYVEMQNSAAVEGDVISYGGDTASTSCGSNGSTYYAICMSGSATIDGTATETDGNVELENSATIDGDAYASGIFYLTGGSKIEGTETPDDSSLSAEAPPAAVAFPTLTLPTTGWNIVSIPNSTYSCSAYFESINDEAGSSSGEPSVAKPDPFQEALESQTERTIYEAPTCDVTYSNSQVFALNPSTSSSTAGDAILDVGTLTFNNSNTFCEESATNSDVCSTATTPGPNLTLVANDGQTSCTPSTVDMQFNNDSDFEPNVDVLVYSWGEVDYANDPSMTGQILACGGLTGTNGFTLSFDPSAGDEVLGSSGSGGTTSTTVTLAVADKYLVSG